MSERDLQRAVRVALGMRSDVVLWQNDSGVAEFKGRMVRYGVGNPGGSDLVGILSVDGIGVALFMELKSATGRQSEHQKRFQGVVESRHGIYLLVRSVDDAVSAIESAIAQLKKRRRSGVEPAGVRDTTRV